MTKKPQPFAQKHRKTFSDFYIRDPTNNKTLYKTVVLPDTKLKKYELREEEDEINSRSQS